jgi:acyl dehydratase
VTELHTPPESQGPESRPVDLQALVARLKARVGHETRATVTEVDKSMIRRFALAIGESSPLYLDAAYASRTRFGGLVAPPTFVSTFIVGHIPDIFDMSLTFERTLHSDDSARLHRPIRAGDTITALARYVDATCRIAKRGPMVFQSADLILDDSRGQRVADVRIVSVSF